MYQFIALVWCCDQVSAIRFAVLRFALLLFRYGKTQDSVDGDSQGFLLEQEIGKIINPNSLAYSDGESWSHISDAKQSHVAGVISEGCKHTSDAIVDAISEDASVVVSK